MTDEAVKAVFEERKRLSAPLVEFVANNTGIPPEVVFRVLLGLGNQVQLAAGQAAAAVLLNKPAEQVTKAEALRAIRGIAKRGENEDRFQRARRAALRETVFLMAPVAYPENLAGLVVGGTKWLDDGLLLGMFAPAERGPGRPGRSVNHWDKHLTIEVVYTETLKNVSRGLAVTIVTGVRADVMRTDLQLPEPTMQRAGDHSALRRIVDTLVKALPKDANDARKAAQAELRGEPDAGFVAFRKIYLAMDKDGANQLGRGG